MKQTAVEWLAAHVNHVNDLHSKELISEDKFRSLLIEYREQAKEKEKERMIGFAKYCLNNAKYLNFENASFNVEEYYEIFKSEQMEENKNKPKLIISDYEWEGNTEYTFEIVGYNVYFSSVGFNTYDEAKIEGEKKIVNLKLE